MSSMTWISILLFTFSATAALPFRVITQDQREVLLIPHGGSWRLESYVRHLNPKIVIDADFIRSCYYREKPCPRAGIALSLPEGKVPRARDSAIQLMVAGKRFRIELLPASFPWYTFIGRSTLTKPIIFSTAPADANKDRHCDLLVVGPNGQLDFHRRMNFVCLDFRPHLVAGKQLYSFQVVTHGSLMGTTGPRVLFDENFRFLLKTEIDYDLHEFLILGPMHWMGIEIALGRLPGGMSYLDRRIRERKDGKVVFDWGVSDFIKVTKSDAAPLGSIIEYKGETVADLIHMNSVTVLPNQKLLVGLGTNGLLVLDKISREIEWILGGYADQFSLPVMQHPFFQHTPTFSPKDQTLYLYSNYHPFLSTTNSSRVLKYELDIAQRKVRAFHVLREKQELSSLMGSLQVDGETLSVGTGTRFFGQLDFLELNNGNVSASLKIDGEPRFTVYRMYRQPFGDAFTKESK